MKPSLKSVRIFETAVQDDQFRNLQRVFPAAHFVKLIKDNFRFYTTTFWYPINRRPGNVFESIVENLKPLAKPSKSVIGVEWWFSVILINATPQWLLSCHFDRNDLYEKNIEKLRHPNKASVLFLNSAPYGELVITDQIMSKKGTAPMDPREMVFVRPRMNRYAVFPGHLYHGVIGRMWRPLKKQRLRIALALNWWEMKPKSSYLLDSHECMSALKLEV